VIPRHVLIRCDANETIGLGHAGRSLALGAALAERFGAVPEVLGRSDPLLARFVTRVGYELLPLLAPGYGTAEVVARVGPGWAVISDSYDLDQDAVVQIAASGAMHVAIDDFASVGEWHDAIVVNPNIGSEHLAYAGARVVAAGPAYALLRPEIARLAGRPRSLAPRGRRLLVCLGGGAWPSESDALLDALAGTTFEVRATFDSDRPEAVPPDTLAEQLEWADVAIVSGGVVKYEAAAAGLPMVVAAVVPHQAIVARAFAAETGAPFGGSLSDVQPSELVALVERLAADLETRAALSARAQDLVDGRGAQRVAALVEAAEA
jgi:spore coat polysaccharide biosynthesis predicted glycosyltransferase SpsG